MANIKKKKFRESLLFSSLVSKSPLDKKIILRPSLKPLYDNIIKNQLSTDTTILITGETGVGKEAIAQIIHQESNRSDKPFIKVDIAVGPETLFESEFFGHEKGAFTGAINRRIGVLERADGGTIFLDEIANISLTAQAKLLRVLESKEFNRVGGNEVIESNFRLICATNKNILDEIKEGRLGEDLYYRINVIPICIPSLREETGDIPIFVNLFLEEFCKKYGVKLLEYHGRLKELIETYQWPGNVRELKNKIDRIVSNYNKGALDIESIFFMGERRNFTKEDKRLSEERNRVIDCLERAGKNKVKATTLYGCSRKHFYNLMHKHKIPL